MVVMIYHSMNRNTMIAKVLHMTNIIEIIRGFIFCISAMLAIEYDNGVNIRGNHGATRSISPKSVNCVNIVCFIR